MFLNEKEGKVVGVFLEVADKYEGKKLVLKWEDGSVVKGIFDSYIEDESDCDMDEEGYEEFWSFVFKAIDLVGKPPVYITEDEYFCVNYHNFPDKITVDGKKIN